MNWNFDTSILIQGIAKSEAAENLEQMITCGTKIVAGISSTYDKKKLDNIPIFPLVEDAVKAVDNIKTSIVFVSPYRVLDASMEAIASGIEQLIIVTSDVPPLDTIELIKVAKANNVAVLGTGSAGIIMPEKMCLGILEPKYFCSGNVALLAMVKL